MTQRDMMRSLIEKYGAKPERVCKEYALVEERGEVTRKSNTQNLTPEEYARRLWKDGEHKGWFSKYPTTQ